MTNNKQQTAVEWLIEQLEYFGNKHELQLSWATVDELVKQAKEMEKGQHSATYGNAMRDFFNKEIDFQKYYEKTYGGNNGE